ncbi:unnamed protein product [Anisakis simplex]|uniref:Rho gtpase activating protein, putative (inferred by orthology to a S. mansoni protein) n=1 Tax=Anisakis simplex TaxID=6269 RepID=A0A0M3K8B2_ANISI|nr:unnamed protein product [Anisakis simplex]
MSTAITMAQPSSSNDRCFISTSLPKFPTQEIGDQMLNKSDEEVEAVSRRRTLETAVSLYDDVHIYANVREMEEESRRMEEPPIPDVTEQPIRDLGDGWLEYLTDTGRSYFYNVESGDSHWKPPRCVKPPLVQASSQVFTASSDACAATVGQYDNVTVPIIEVINRQEDDLDASCSAPVSPIVPAKSLSDMIESIDSGIGRTSISVRNKVADGIAENRLSFQQVAKEIAKRTNAHRSIEELYAAECAHFGSGSNRSEDGRAVDRVALMSHLSSSVGLSQNPIKRGTLNKCQVADAGNRLKKREWSSCYLFLSSEHIIFYKDEKSAEKCGRHYEAPSGMCELRGAQIQWLDSEKDKRKKHDHIIQLKSIDGTVYLFSASDQDINGWFHAIRSVIYKLVTIIFPLELQDNAMFSLKPRPDPYPTPVLERMNTASGVSRSPSNLSYSHSLPFGSAPARSSSKKGKSPNKDMLSCSPAMDDGRMMAAAAAAAAAASSATAGATESVPTRASIIEKLKRFFRSRPTIDSLKEKGIYRPEPVFGSTLQTICHHEQRTVPRFIQLVTEVIESRGLDTDGLYRVSGNLSAIQKIRCHVDQDKYNVLFREEDVHVLTGALKLFFRELSEPIFPTNLAKEFIHVNRSPNDENKIKKFDELLRRLPLVNRETLKVLFGHLLKVANHADKNRMEIHNLAIMFGPSLFSSGIEPNSDNKKGSNASKKKHHNDKKQKERTTVQSNSHLAFDMIMQGQTVEFLLREFRRFPILHAPPIM